MMLTILQLLSDGADPNLVKSPQPALFIAITSSSSDLVRHLVNYGANINESYKEVMYFCVTAYHSDIIMLITINETVLQLL